jgi:hypothetical protein
MSASLFNTEFDAFYAFLGELRSREVGPISPEESVERFRESQAKLRRFHELNEVAAAQSQSGSSTSLDLQAILYRVEQRVQNIKTAQ